MTYLLGLECMHRYEEIGPVTDSDAGALGNLQRTQALLHDFLVLLLPRLWKKVLTKKPLAGVLMPSLWHIPQKAVGP